MKKVNKQPVPHLSRQRRGFLFLFGVPAFALYCYICILPLVTAFFDSFTDWAGYTSDKQFIGWANYVEVFQDPIFYKAILNDIIFTVVKLVVITTLALVFAVSLTRIGLSKVEVKIHRYLLYLPTVLPIIVVTIVWRFIFNADGVLNNALAALTGNSYMDFPAWMDQFPIAMISFVACWGGIGYSMIVLIAAINNVSSELYEAAAIDGAGQWKQFWNVTIPGIMGQIRYVAIMLVSSSFASNMNLVLPMTNGEPDNASTVMGLYVYKHGLDSIYKSRVGYANAAAVILMIISFAVCFSLNRFLAKKEAD